MKKQTIFIMTFLVLLACSEQYNFNEKFLVPDAFFNPEIVKLDRTSSELVEFTWTGGGAEDGGVLLYEVLFDVPDGDFSKPLYTGISDLGGLPQLTLSHIELDQIAKSAGLKAAESGIIKWTVKASRGGEMKMATKTGSIILIRPDMEIPGQLYLMGTGSENGGLEPVEFREITTGVFLLYTKTIEGEGLFFTDGQEEPETYIINESGNLAGSEDMFTIPFSHPVRITVNFNTMQVAVEEISVVQMIFGANFEIIAELEYAGGGRFKAENVPVNFLQPGDPEWLTWTDERYYFIVSIDDRDICWGRMDGITDQHPDPDLGLKYYEIGEFVWDQWEHLWKFDPEMDGKTCTVYIDTNLEDMIVHQFTDIR